MLKIVTGLPGAGKTLYTLAEMLPEFRGRQIYFSGIPAVNHEHFGSHPLDDPEKWYELPEGSVVVIDEAQRIFPVRKAGSPVPEKCSQFETHRHRGFDIVLITQDATTLDVHIRKLAGAHIHVHRLFGAQAATVYEYATFQPKPTNGQTQKLANSVKTWRYKKEIYGLYKSADMHTVKRKIPRKLLVIPFIFIFAIGAFTMAFIKVKGLIATDDIEETVSPVAEQSDSGNPYGATPERKGPMTVEEYLARFVPRIDGMPWTAPLYDDVMDPETFPRPFCIIYAPGREHERCECYSQQATKMDVAVQACRDIARNGWFDYTKDERRESRATRASLPSASR